MASCYFPLQYVIAALALLAQPPIARGDRLPEGREPAVESKTRRSQTALHRCGAPTLGAIGEFLAHYQQERNHQGLGNGLLSQAANEATYTTTRDDVRLLTRLGGLLSYYEREAA